MAESKVTRTSNSKIDDLGKVIVDSKNNKKYILGKFLGKGGFAKCYELIDEESKISLAVKIISKIGMLKNNSGEKIVQEIEIHRGLSHNHVVQFHSHFDDKENVYIVLELCKRRSLMEMHKRRRQLTERESRYFVRQIALGCQYLHQNKIIHRDLKLGNLFLNECMEIKIGDFGLATRLEQEGERRRTMCGTPNYIAPEIIAKKGHSYEVDAWSLGCILYTLLVGRPPFETSSIKDTYNLIRKNYFTVPTKFSYAAQNLIKSLLHPDPKQRPTMDQVLIDEFILEGHPIPKRLPTSCLSTVPRLDDSIWQTASMINFAPKDKEQRKVMDKQVELPTKEAEDLLDVVPSDYYLSDLYQLLKNLMATKPSGRLIEEGDAEDPESVPIFWVSKWLDYTDRYGLGYQLCDNSLGVLFNDDTRIILLEDELNIQYVDKERVDHYFKVDDYPQSLKKKLTLLNHFKSYMQEHLLKAGGAIQPRESDEITRLPYLRFWFRTRRAIILHLSNGTLQFNFFSDHSKIILCPLMEAVSYIDENKNFRTFKFKRLEEFGCSRKLAARLEYIQAIALRMIEANGRPSSSPK